MLYEKLFSLFRNKTKTILFIYFNLISQKELLTYIFFVEKNAVETIEENEQKRIHFRN